ncbi:conjugal transfer protein TraI [Paraflavitalea sp. CAU 1676]|uniref:conjugal transfer protein TraI n=1 Tax=Paraflavitalea sp. CAU 1676 TaxID=3032598 RepID=UPI0023DCD16A|nr:conjugal transfer protein TraI [Paraflavitalea sp. CAU 1676]MDF2191366.1 conjugal transfer protein TraI [Paraflavitalea sp. CAU 1676]
MKKFQPPITAILLGLFMCLLAPGRSEAQDPIVEAVKEASKKIIKAVDLQIQRIQNATLDLQNVQKEIENILSKLKLNEIADWTNRQKELYQQYFDELWRVKAAITYYRQFKSVVNKQKQLFEEYKRAYQIVGQDPNFSPDERNYMFGVYANILEESIGSIGGLVSIMKSFTIQMSDAGRLEAISKTNKEIDNHLTALRQFNQRNRSLSFQRARSVSEIQTLKSLYGIN